MITDADEKLLEAKTKLREVHKLLLESQSSDGFEQLTEVYQNKVSEVCSVILKQIHKL